MWRAEAYAQAGHDIIERPWVGLTDEEKQEAYFKIDLWRECIDFIEAKLKEKNGL
jgi:hypothetical protein